MSIKGTYGNDQSSVIPNSPELENETPTHRMGTRSGVGPHHGILHSNKEKKAEGRKGVGASPGGPRLGPQSEAGSS